MEAYLNATTSSEKDGPAFVWSLPHVEHLRAFLNTKLGWNTFKIDEMILPIVRRLARANNSSSNSFIRQETQQGTLDSFFKVSKALPKFDSGRSKSSRISRAVTKLKTGSPYVK